MPTILIKTLEEITNKRFINKSKEEVSPMIKVYYYNYKENILNKDQWIESISDVEKFRSNIQGIAIVPSTAFRPPMSETIKMVLDDIGNEPTFMVVIGDAGDETYRGTDYDESPLFQEFLHNKVHYSLRGIRINSNPDALGYGSVNYHADYTKAYNEFDKNFKLIKDVPFNTAGLSTAEAENIGEEIANSIVSDLQKVIDALADILSGKKGNKILDDSFPTLSSFSQAYLKGIKELKFSKGKGTFFAEGYVHLKDTQNNSLYGKDVLIETEKIRRLKDACKEYSTEPSVNKAKKLLRKTLAVFFEVDYEEVDEEFLEEKSYNDLWTAIVGDKAIADKLVPGLFKTDINFKDLIENLTTYESQLLENAKVVSNSLTHHLNEKIGKYTVVTDISAGFAESYYWIDVEDINLFKGITFR
jgi:hypothetical protein